MVLFRLLVLASALNRLTESLTVGPSVSSRRRSSTATRLTACPARNRARPATASKGLCGNLVRPVGEHRRRSPTGLIVGTVQLFPAAGFASLGALRQETVDRVTELINRGIACSTTNPLSRSDMGAVSVTGGTLSAPKTSCCGICIPPGGSDSGAKGLTIDVSSIPLVQAVSLTVQCEWARRTMAPGATTAAVMLGGKSLGP